jgi:hypothetical protein
MSLKKTIENTLINNLDLDANGIPYGAISYESIERCSDYIAQEIKDVATGFALAYENHCNAVQCGWETQKRVVDAYDEYIADRYKEDK